MTETVCFMIRQLGSESVRTTNHPNSVAQCCALITPLVVGVTSFFVRAKINAATVAADVTTIATVSAGIASPFSQTAPIFS